MSYGIHRKFEVRRADGSTDPGGKHEHCNYFVLDLEHDDFAIVALKAYASACRKENPHLADDLDRIVATRPCGCRGIATCPHMDQPQTPNEMLGMLVRISEGGGGR